MKILFCADGSEYSEYAIEYAAGILKTGAEATVLYVSPEAGSIYDHYMVVEEDFTEKVVEISTRILQHASDILKQHDIKAEIKERSGHAADQIIKEVSSGDYDMVVVGSYGAAGLPTSVLGSVSTKVVYASTVPVLVVKRPKS